MLPTETHLLPRLLPARGTAVLMLAVAACVGDDPIDPSPGDVADAARAASMARSQAPFVTWHQGFQHGVDGWYDARTAGPLGWCGFIDAVDARPSGEGDVAPSAGRGYATVTGGPCNDYWPIPGGGPYAPGPDAALFSDAWPRAGYVTELDIHLDPAWSGEHQGLLSDFYPNTLVQLGATVFPLDYQVGDAHSGPHWFATVDAVSGEEALTVFDHRIDEAGWYTFRFVFSEEEGSVRAAFELRDRSGRLLTRVDPHDPVALQGPVKVPFGAELPTDGYGSGHIWFFDVPADVALPIDEHRVRPGR